MNPHIGETVSREEDHDLGFRARIRKSGDVEVLHHGRVAATVRGEAALSFLVDLDIATVSEAQQLMARITGNYKRGNERLASQHPRNRI